ncbi:hypothetical protein HY771_01705 [Candidatus Uhrbacteria bacterium]|nr:hypothetical protein [Candidatus Uhrbacteria bacterium]MBI4812359.1 hypothetical protein [Candidatus Falkowbacteria bacterium]
MPIVRVLNWPCRVNVLGKESVPFDRCLKEAIVADNMFRRRMGDDLRRAVVRSNISGITSADLVTVSFDSGHVFPDPTHNLEPLNDDKTLVIVVEGLFERKDRTKSDRDRLAKMLMHEAVSQLNDPNWKVEVLVMRFNVGTDSYCKSE